MTGDWQPGDVALVDFTGLGDWRVATYDDSGRYANWWWCGKVRDADLSKARPVAVIDPEDRQAVERLILAMPANRDWYFVHTGVDGNPVVDEYVAANFQAALREFAAPTPPRPNEPTGRFAEVENAEGMTYYRSPCGSWRRASDDLIRDWQAIDAVRVLSEGIEQP